MSGVGGAGVHGAEGLAEDLRDLKRGGEAGKCVDEGARLEPGAPAPAGRPKVFVAMPVYGAYNAHFARSLLKFVTNYPGNADWIVMDFPGDSLVSRARNRLAALFLASDATHLLFLDTDLIFSSEQIGRLVSHDEEVVAGLYPKKQDELAWVINTRKELPQVPDERGLQPVGYAGTGCLLIKRCVFEKVARMFPELEYEPDDGEPAGRYFDFFKVGVCVTQGRRRYLSEDWYFCEMALQCGVTIWADTRVVLKHVGEAVYPRVDPFERKPEAGDQRPEEGPAGSIDAEATLRNLKEWGEKEKAPKPPVRKKAVGPVRPARVKGKVKAKGKKGGR